MTDNFKEIGSLFGREGAGAGSPVAMSMARIPCSSPPANLRAR